MMTNDARPGPSQRTRFAPSRVSTVWQNVRSHLAPPVFPSSTSDSVVDSSFNHNDMYNESLNVPVHLDLLNPRSGTSGRHKRHTFARRRTAKSSQANSTSRFGDDEDTEKPGEPVSHVVVDANFDYFSLAIAKSDSGSTTRTPLASAANTPGGGNDLIFPKTERGEDESGDEDGAKSEADSFRRDTRKNWWQRTVLYEWTVERIWPNIQHFFDSSFPEPSKERSFRKEVGFVDRTIPSSPI